MLCKLSCVQFQAKQSMIQAIMTDLICDAISATSGHDQASCDLDLCSPGDQVIPASSAEPLLCSYVSFSSGLRLLVISGAGYVAGKDLDRALSQYQQDQSKVSYMAYIRVK